MTLKEQISKDIISAMKEKDSQKRDTLKYVKSQIQKAEMEKNAKEVDDSRVIKLIEKSIEGMVEVGDEESLAQVSILETYIPQKLTEDEIVEALKVYVGLGNDLNIGSVMKYFKEQYGGKADNKIVSRVARELI